MQAKCLIVFLIHSESSQFLRFHLPPQPCSAWVVTDVIIESVWSSDFQMSRIR